MPGTLISDLLLSSGLLTPEKTQEAQGVMKQKLCSLEEAVLHLRLISREALYGAVADQLRVSYVELEEYQADPKVLGLIPEQAARKYRAFPLFRIQQALIVAMADPTDLVAIDALRQTNGCLIEAHLSSESEIGRAIDEKYGTYGETRRFLEELSSRPEQAEAATTAGVEAPAAKLVDLILTQAVREKASDIHVEPDNRLLRIRFRIDGILHESSSPPKTMEAAIISRLKVLGDLDIAENRIPQDGHFQMQVDDRRVDVRVATLPTVYGENVVLRLLDTAEVFVGLERLGFGSDALKQYEKAIREPYGIILSTGPTGSGKTTTLYSALMRISTVEKNIVTIEDPVEYRLGLIRQVQVNPKAGITFASGLRSILRQDPDVIMVGEIRDRETAEIAIQASLTGHLVFSTLHTNDAPSSVIRLINMGVEPFLIAASVTCLMAQRLVRTVCESCKVWYEPPSALMERFGLKAKGQNPIKIAKGAGCARCRDTGYSGRIGIFELMTLDDELRERILSNPSIVGLRDTARRKGMKLLIEDGVDKVLAGLTTPEEVLRVTEQSQAL